MMKFQDPMTFSTELKIKDLEVRYSNLMEVSQGGPEIGNILINGKKIDGRFGGPILYDNGYLYVPAYVKKFFGTGTYVQSVGVKNDLEIDGFSIAVCQELNVELSRHRSRSFDEMEQWGDDLSSFDLVVSLSPASQRRALELTRFFHLDVEYWPILDPTGLGETREAKLASYRQTRDQIIAKLIDHWGDPIRTD